jgi:Fuc2NAc and GlcNAc transferase
MNACSKWLAVAAFAIAIFGTGAMRRYAIRKNMLDVPNSRSSHAAPKPRGGGVAIAAAFFATLTGIAAVTNLGAALLAALLLGGATIAGVGWLDDRRTLSAGVRFAVHIAAAVGVVQLIGTMPEGWMAAWGLHGAWIGFCVAVVALLCMTNVFNFMDGIDGLAAGQAAFMCLAGAWLTWHRSADAGMAGAWLCLAGASLGFLAWNLPPARIFMGDVGSGFLGFTITALGLATIQRDGMPIEVWAILGGVFLVDATITLARRMLRGDRWLQAHRSHAYQRLARRWNGHRPATALAMAINVFWLLPWAVAVARTPADARWMLAAALSPLAVLVLLAGAGSRES